MSIPDECLVLVDGSSYLFRAYHALPPLITQDGQPTGAIYGVVAMLRKLLLQYPHAKIAVVFDTPEPTFRHKLFDAYKSNRGEMAEDLSIQIEPLFEIIQAMGLPLLRHPGWEADDIIGTLAHQAEQAGCFSVIVTSDKDFTQLVTENIILLNTMTEKILDVAGVVAKFGVQPYQMIDFLTLTGDTVDNIPGVPKVGPKTAMKWLQTYGDLTTLVAQAESLTGKIGQNFRDFIPQIPLTRDLVTICLDVPLEQTWDMLERQPYDEISLTTLFERYQFKQWRNLADFFGQEVAPETPQTTVVYEVIDTQASLERWIQKLRATDTCIIDTETTSLTPHEADLVGIALALDPKQVAYIPLAHDDVLQQLDTRLVLIALQEFFTNKAYTFVGHHLKYDMLVLARYGVRFTANLFDTMLASYVYNSTATSHSLDALAAFYLKRQTTTFEEIAGKGVKQKTFNEIPLSIAAPYAAEDAEITALLYDFFRNSLEEQPRLQKLLKMLEMPLSRVLMIMESHGVLIDCKALEQQSRDLGDTLDFLEQQAFTAAGEDFNLNSPKQLQHILFDVLGLPILKKTGKGQPSTAEPVLQALAQEYSLPALILEYRRVAKLKSTYTDKLPQQVNPKTQRIHTSYHQAVTATGRLSSAHPNLQNIPIRHEAGRRIRSAFIAPHEYVLIAADYSQIELRIMAEFSKDEGLIQAFKQGEDIHTTTAAAVFQVSHDQVTQEQRRQAKAINFGLIYGMSAFGLAQQLQVSREEAEAFIEIYFQRFPGVEAFMETTRELARRQGFVETLWGRRLYLPEIRSRNIHQRHAAERAAINAPMQGTAADLIKFAMIRVQDWLECTSLRAVMTMQVHDELVFEVHQADQQKVMTHIRPLMEVFTELTVPMQVAFNVGPNWNLKA